jgi:hypothetical protein
MIAAVVAIFLGALAFASFGVGPYYDVVMFGVLALCVFQFLAVVVLAPIKSLGVDRFATKTTFALWFGLLYPFILIRDTAIGIPLSMAVAPIGFIFGFFIVSVLRWLAARVVRLLSGS